MNEEFVRAIGLAIKRGFITIEEGRREIMNMIEVEKNSRGLNWVHLVDRIEKIEGFLNI